MALNLVRQTLENEFVRLEPLEESHREVLRAPASDERIWTYLSINGAGAGYDTWFDAMFAANQNGSMIGHAVFDKRQQSFVGHTSYMNIVAAHEVVEIGSTWYAPNVWAGYINPACKRLLIGNAFEALNAYRVELKTDERNERSASAILRLGTQFEGIMRGHMIMPDGHRRNTKLFAMIKPEWPQVREGLDARLKEFM